MSSEKSVLFVCTHNSARSFMAEYLGRSKYLEITFRSAGIRPLGPEPAAVAVLREEGIDTDGHRPATIGSFSGEHFDLVVFLCPNAMKLAYSYPSSKDIILREFRVPAGGTDRLTGFRELRDNLKVFIDEIVEVIQN
ncbi:MAG: arsenate reductase ArsC [Methanomicrobiaceae archaeon]|nr:arsenate reductase ArsC [Methanomicrobiaceae archaeon]